jgi:hypothetical protein
MRRLDQFDDATALPHPGRLPDCIRDGNAIVFAAPGDMRTCGRRRHHALADP